MKPFRLYIRGFGAKQQLVWAGVWLIIICTVIIGISYLKIYLIGPIPPGLEDEFPEIQIHWDWIKYSIGGIVVGLLMLLAGGFAADVDEKGK